MKNQSADCRCAGRQPESDAASLCPESGTRGAPVELQTVKALLTDTALSRVGLFPYRFCADASCDVVYFDLAGACYRTGDVRVPVWQKEPFGKRTVCYCFGESEASICAEIAAAGQSDAVERVRAHIAAGRCACEIRNPRGACCLGDLSAAVKRVETAMGSEFPVLAES